MKVAWDEHHLDGAARAELRGWLLLAVGALAAAGGLALALAAARTPGVQEHMPWGPEFFRRGLVAHVVLSFQVWLLAMTGALSTEWGGRPAGWVGLALAATGAVLVVVPAMAGMGDASLNNYVPVLDHPLYLCGLTLLAAGVGVAGARGLFGRGSGAAGAAVAVSLLSALACFGLAVWLIPAGTPAEQRYEAQFWGGGHVLQFVNTALLMIGWQGLCRAVWGRAAVPPRLAVVAFAVLALGAVVAPALYVLDPLGPDHRQAFTTLFVAALPVPPLLMGAAVAWRLWRGPRPWRSPALLALVLSLAVFALGGAAGYALGQGDTRTPSHYHAVIGGVNLALIGLIHVRLLPCLGRGGDDGRWVRAQIWLYGGGQALHAFGFYVAGAEGVARKTAGAAQGLDSAAKLAGMGLAGLGAAVAVLGGVVFVVQVLGRLLRRR